MTFGVYSVTPNNENYDEGISKVDKLADTRAKIRAKTALYL